MAKQVGFGEIGITGLPIHSGYVNEEFLTQLQGPRGMRVYKEMSSNDATIGAILFAVEHLTRTAIWQVEAASDTPEAVEAADWLRSIMDDMDGTWQELLTEMRTSLVYGWAYFEVVYKRRVGPDQKDKTKKSKYNDGMIGVRKIAIRAQDTLNRWEMSGSGDILGMWQDQLYGEKTGTLLIPMGKSLLFRTTSRKGSPEGRSLLRPAYESWYYLKHIRGYEAVGIERELAGLPVLRVPGALMASTNASDVTVMNKYEQMVRDVRINEQGGIILPSDVYMDSEGKPTQAKMYELSLLSGEGSRSIDTDTVVRRYQRDIARSVLADFLMLGNDGKGSYALSEDKSSMFLDAIETFNGQDAQVLNRNLIPNLWEYNSFDKDLMPRFKPGRVKKADLGTLGTYIADLMRAGAPMFPDDNLENHLREEGGLPSKTDGALG